MKLFFRKKEKPRHTRESLLAHRENLANQVVLDLREQQLGLQPDYPVRPSQQLEESLLLSRLGVPPVRYQVESTGDIPTMAPRIRATMPDEQHLLDEINAIRALNKTFYGDDE